MPVLVLDGHSRAAVETVQSLGRAGIETDVAAESLSCPVMRSRYPRRKLLQPQDTASSKFHDWLREQHSQRNYQLIVPTTEASLLAFRFLGETDLLRKRAALPDNRALDIALDKQKTWQLARELGVPAPESILLSAGSALDEPARYPLVLKPLRSKVSIGGKLQTIAAEVIRNEEAYQRHLERWLQHTPWLRQEYIYGRGVGANFLFERGRKLWEFVHERVHELPLTGGASSYRRSIPSVPALVADAEKLLASLGWHGVAMVEFRVDAQGRHWLMEINPRLWGSLALAIDSGVDFPLGLWRLAQDLKTPPQPIYRANYYTRDLRSDLEWMKDNLRAARGDPLLLTRPRFISVLEFLRPLIGRESWDHWDWRDLSVTKAVLAAAIGDQVRALGRKLRGHSASG